MNLYYNKNLLAELKLCNTIFSKFKGLIFTRKLKNKQGIIIPLNQEKISQAAIHMLFVFYNIDVLWLDKDYKIVDLRRNLKPFTFAKPRNKAKYIVELPADSTSNINIGSKLQIK